jgi:hypothetical protein
MAIKTGLGCTLGFGTTTTYTPDFTSITGPSTSLGSLVTSHLGTTGGYHTKVAEDLRDGGTVDCDIWWDPLDGYPPLAGVLETITITNNDTGAATEAFSGFIGDFSGASRQVGSLMTASITINVCGAVTFTA